MGFVCSCFFCCWLVGVSIVLYNAEDARVECVYVYLALAKSRPHLHASRRYDGRRWLRRKTESEGEVSVHVRHRKPKQATTKRAIVRTPRADGRGKNGSAEGKNRVVNWRAFARTSAQSKKIRARANVAWSREQEKRKSTKKHIDIELRIVFATLNHT